MTNVHATTYTEARKNFAALCDAVTGNRETVLIRRPGKEDVALIAASELRSLLETAHLAASPANARRLERALRDARAGRRMTRMSSQQLRAWAECTDGPQGVAGRTTRRS